MLGAVVTGGIVVTILLSGSFVASPIAYFIHWIETTEQLANIIGYIKWFLPWAKLVWFFGLWLTVILGTILVFLVMRIFKLI